MDDEARLSALGRMQILETAPEEPFEKIVNLVRTVLAVPISTVSLVDRERQWFKAYRGLDVRETPRSISFCNYTIQQAEPLTVEDALLDERFARNPLVLGGPKIRSYAGVPLRSPDGYNVGSLCAIDTTPRRFSPADIAILKNFANIVSDELELRLIASTDHLTGALSRRAFEEQVNREFARNARYHRPSTLVAFDIDHFKKINDEHGHPAGDEVLRHIGRIATQTLRPTDFLGRMGGEEFAILLPETSAAEALVAAERLRHSIQNHDFELPGGEAIKVTSSFGVSPIGSFVDVGAWFASVDQVLYDAKSSGRNCTHLAA
ncbi:sensor domain-containing diguanylate cyclase [Sphingomonas sp. 22176]|uniref:sensor domain-containing diguanylate cyclase n=1 Tax=Sphingomonas sp. 22176 TaxID=3453884 RepID=UPI003F83F63E